MTDLPDLVARARLSADFPIEFADDSTEGWFSRNIGQAMHLLNVPESTEAEKSMQEDALVILDGVSGDLQELGREGAAALLRKIYAGDASGALSAWKYYLGRGLSYDERRALHQLATREALEEQERRQAAWDSFVETVREIGIDTLRAIIPALLAGL